MQNPLTMLMGFFKLLIMIIKIPIKLTIKDNANCAAEILDAMKHELISEIQSMIAYNQQDLNTTANVHGIEITKIDIG